MTEYGPTDDMLVTFGVALADALHDAHASPKDAAEVVGWTADYVLKLTRGLRVPNPWALFALELHLGVAPGELSRHLGYLPVAAPPSVVAAIEADKSLTPSARAMLVATYRAGRRG